MTESEKLYDLSKELLPGGVNSPVRAFQAVGRTPLFIDHAKGSHIYDVDGKQYIDYVSSWGPCILGHANERVVEKVREACLRGLSFGAPTENEYILAKLISAAMPSIEMLRLVSSGTEAVMSAIRVARAYTGKDKIIKFRGCYHGHSDGLLVKAGSGALTNAIPDSLGVPRDITKNTLLAEYNDIESVKGLFGEQDDIAAIIIEPVAANMGVVPPKDGFLRELRRLCDETGALLIFDEVITGFRLALGGAQEYYGIQADLTTLGKIVGGGMPLAAYGGRREIMEMLAPMGPVYQAGTLSGNPIATTAGIETIRQLMEHREIYKDIEEKASKIAEYLRTSLGRHVSVNAVGSLLSVFFTEREVVDYDTALSSSTSEYSRYFQYMLSQGIYLAPSQFEAMFISYALSDADIEKTCQAISDFANMWIA